MNVIQHLIMFAYANTKNTAVGWSGRVEFRYEPEYSLENISLQISSFFLAVCASFNERLSERPCLNIEFFTRDLMTSVHLESSRLVTELFIFVHRDGFVSFHLGWQHPGLTIWCLFLFLSSLSLSFFSSLKKYKYVFVPLEVHMTKIYQLEKYI